MLYDNSRWQQTSPCMYVWEKTFYIHIYRTCMLKWNIYTFENTKKRNVLSWGVGMLLPGNLASVILGKIRLRSGGIRTVALMEGHQLTRQLNFCPSHKSITWCIFYLLTCVQITAELREDNQVSQSCPCFYVCYFFPEYIFSFLLEDVQ